MRPSEADPREATVAAPYTALAEGYETVMAHVDYDRWAGHAHDLLQAHTPWPLGPRALLELGCGTGALARRLQPRGPYRYLATDRSEAMLVVARRRARAQQRPIRFRQVDFTRIGGDLPDGTAPGGTAPGGPPFDAALLLYDGLNYLLKARQVRRLFEGVAGVLRPGGLFLFDQSTPANSADPAGFDDEGSFEQKDGRTVRYRRESRYDPARRLHETTFAFWGGPKGRRTEHHVQRVYARRTIRSLLRASPLVEKAAYDGFSTDPADEESRRVHWVAQLRE